ncbi:hypothetical protein [Donghicola mangrovi]|uniref:Tubulin/FtsZ GTPase domain-containing protein n=1 Tax=Donghicola mangrovi TaxID=2729614 RepID=A0A850Q0S7_9RHOB|nr:hypothetical protein [Donghicola mangrovi]NVO22633.1 hypothetical protein [Donghicola mangrovi]
MTSDLSVLGFGQCGSKVAVELSANFNPAKILKGEGIFELAFKYAKERVTKTPAFKGGDSSPAFYIADLNSNNDLYVYFAKAQAIYEVAKKKKNFSELEIMEHINQKNPGFLDDGDLQIVSEIREKGEAFSLVQALHFEIKNKPLLDQTGAGGIPYLSEAIAESDDHLLSAIDQRHKGALFGVFAMGGGTGSGSLYSVLTRYRKAVGRYTVGVGILPENTSKNPVANSGRYLAKFMGALPQDRYHTLFLFSNQAANEALQISDAGPESDPMSIINSYVSRFVKDFSNINSSKTITKFGKDFDPRDASLFLNGVCSVGHASSNDFNARDLFSKAMSPLALSASVEEGLTGLSVKVTRKSETQLANRSIEKLVESICRNLFQGDEPDADEVEALMCATPFYRTIKSVYVFIFLRNSSDSNNAFSAKQAVINFFKAIAGSEVSVEINCYYTPESKESQSSVLVAMNGAFSFEMYESMMGYVQEAFFEQPVSPGVFKTPFDTILRDIQHLDSLQAMNLIRERVLEITNGDHFRSAEYQKNIEKLGIATHAEFKKVLTAEKLEKLLVNRNCVERALMNIAVNFTLGMQKQEEEVDPFSSFSSARKRSGQISSV